MVKLHMRMQTIAKISHQYSFSFSAAPVSTVIDWFSVKISIIIGKLMQKDLAAITKHWFSRKKEESDCAASFFTHPDELSSAHRLSSLMPDACSHVMSFRCQNMPSNLRAKYEKNYIRRKKSHGRHVSHNRLALWIKYVTNKCVHTFFLGGIFYIEPSTSSLVYGSVIRLSSHRRRRRGRRVNSKIRATTLSKAQNVNWVQFFVCRLIFATFPNMCVKTYLLRTLK